VVLKVKEQEVKEADSIVQAEAESKEKAKKAFSVWSIALIICVLVVAIGLSLFQEDIEVLYFAF